MSSESIRNSRISKEVRQLNVGIEHHGKLNVENKDDFTIPLC